MGSLVRIFFHIFLIKTCAFTSEREDYEENKRKIEMDREFDE